MVVVFDTDRKDMYLIGSGIDVYEKRLLRSSYSYSMICLSIFNIAFYVFFIECCVFKNCRAMKGSLLPPVCVLHPAKILCKIVL